MEISTIVLEKFVNFFEICTGKKVVTVKNSENMGLATKDGKRYFIVG